MESGIFHTPYMRPGRSDKDTFNYSVMMAREADQAGFRDFMIGEHATQAWENIPNPELVIAACARETERMRFAPMAHILPLQHPAALAIQTGYLSQILGGRYFLGVGAGSWEGDAITRGQPGDLSEAHPRMNEALEIMEKIWKREPFSYKGKFWNAGYPDPQKDAGHDIDTSKGADYHLLADHSPFGGAENMEIAVTGLSPNSPSLKMAGERGYTPISFFGGAAVLKKQWEVYSEACESVGAVPDGAKFKVSRDIFVADTDKEAKERAINGPLGYAWTKYLIPVYKKYGIIKGYVDDSGQDISVNDVDVNWIAENIWLCGSPDTVIEKIERSFEKVGFRYGQIAMNAHDAMDDPAPWIHSMQLLANEVAPKIHVPGTHDDVSSTSAEAGTVNA